ncbi:unnamed protein product [Ilex paraguariensis]|uniref:F-box domain-containing protein n=1 Tax=Ilex paraguariensis TaxID=185542 RepID=A0ABC8SCS0_9AQUA
MKQPKKGASLFSLLPEDCISAIISLTSPRDACRASAISSAFKLAANSDIVWEKFLPYDYPEIISRSVSPVVYSTKKELYFRLCNSPILLDGSKLVLVLIAVPVVDIGTKMQTHMLSPNTTYAAYLVFKLPENKEAYEVTAKSSVRFLAEIQDGAEASNNRVYLKTATKRTKPQNRVDGWMEIEMGEFKNDHGDGGELEIQLTDIMNLTWFSCPIVEGIELRPKENHDLE